MPSRNFILLATLIAIIAVIGPLLQTPSTPKQREPHQGRNQTVLFVSNSEPGLANVLLATSHALLIHHSAIEVHYASFLSLQKHLSRVSDAALVQSPASSAITFHELKGSRYWDALNEQDHYVTEMMHAPGLSGSLAFSRNFTKILAPWNGPQYFSLYEQISRVIEDVDPAVIAVDMILEPALDAAKDKNRKHVVLSPNTLLDLAGQFQPWGSLFWKYPAPGSGYSYPVPWKYIPANIWMYLRIISNLLTSSTFKAKQKYLKEKGILDPINILSIHDPVFAWITQSSQDVDFPISTIPNNFILCGPISLSTAPAAEQDPELNSWLERAPTVLINLGSLFDYDEKSAKAMAGAIKVLLEKTNVQVLWKFNKRKYSASIAQFSENILSLVSEYLGPRLRIESWIAIDPAAMLASGNIVATVHHGGSSCYHEAVENGVPQIVLPMWADCYLFATRVEWFRIGVWGAKADPLNWTKEELSQAFLRVLSNNEEAEMIRLKARELGMKLQAKKPGRICAADELARLAALDGMDIET